MAITIRGYDADGDGTGLDFAGYIKSFEADFVRNGRGFFSDDARDLGGNQYAISSSTDSTLPIDSGLSIIADSGTDGDFAYDFTNNTVGGTLHAIEFGDGLSYDAATDSFATKLDLAISGLGLGGSGPENPVHSLLVDLQEADADVLLARLAGDDINFIGSSGADKFKGFSGDDFIRGGRGGDFLNGGGGADVVWGGAGNDTVVGGRGADTLSGDGGNDVLTGNGGADTFNFSGRFGVDVITDFQAGRKLVDVIVLDAAKFADFDAVLARTEDVDGSAVITIGANSITLTGVLEADLRANDFLFV